MLIANRGEIAIRILRACKLLGLGTVAVFSDADRHALHVGWADEAYHLGPSMASQSYLNMRRIIAVAQKSGTDAIHPGYGFLSENARFARAVHDAGMIFIGPSPESIELMGNKSHARKFVSHLDIPTIAGSSGVVDSIDEALAIARKVGFPLLIKASAGGGGRGLRIVHTLDELASQFTAAQREAHGVFGDASVYLEKFLDRPRHVEVQILGDGKGAAIALGERECSLQRRHQKLVEEAPCTALDDRQRARLWDSAVRIGNSVNYRGAGTVEFLVQGRDYFFVEMNTRIQVEHPVTEWVTGLDLVKEQLLIATEWQCLSDIDWSIRGNAVECRINAENPDKDFVPSPGTVQNLTLPGGHGIRIDSALCEGNLIPPYYDSLIAKISSWGNTRHEALQRMSIALDEFSCQGINTTAPYLRELLSRQDVRDGMVDTQMITRLNEERRVKGPTIL